MSIVRNKQVSVLKSMEQQSELSVILWVFAVEACLLSRIPLYLESP